MPDPNPQGKSSSDFRKEASVGTLVRQNGITAREGVNPLGSIQDDLRQVAASKLMNTTLKTLTADEIKADTERMKAEIENRKIEAESNAARQPAQAEGQMSELTAFIVEQWRDAQAELREARQAQAAAQAEKLHDRMQMLERELADMRAQPPQEQIDTGDLIDRELDKAEKLLKRVTPPPAPGLPEAAVLPIQFEIEKFRTTAEMEREQRRMDAEKETREWQRRYEFDRLQAEREQARQDKHAESMDRVLNGTLPKVVGLIEQGMTALLQRQAAAVAPPVAPAVQPAARVVSAPAVAPAVRGELPPGVKVKQCDQCGYGIPYREEFRGVICPRCMAEYSQGPDRDADPEERGPSATDTPIAAVSFPPTLDPES